MEGTTGTVAASEIAIDHWLNFEQVMAITGMKRTFIQSEINSGRLKSLKVGRSRKVRKSALEAWMAGFDGAGQLAGSK